MKKLGELILEKREVMIAGITILAIIGMSFASPIFLTPDNWLSLLLSMSNNIIMAVGMMNLMVSGGFDMSIGSTMALAGGLCAICLNQGMNPVISIIAGLLAACAMGAFNGISVAKLGISAFVTTLATQQMGRGLVMVLMNGKNISGLPDNFKWIGQMKIAGIQLPIIYAFVFMIVGGILLSKAKFFRQNYYIGGNEKAARLSGINVSKMQIINYTIMGLLAGVAGIIQTARMATASTTTGDGGEMKVITAVIIGGASLSGGEGSILGAVIGVLLMAIINNAMVLLNINVYWQTFVTGLTLFLAVLIDIIARNRKAKMK